MRLLLSVLVTLAIVAVVCATKTASPTSGPRFCMVSKSGDCPSDEFCEQDDGLCGGHGQCSKMPNVCYKIYRPVCGCDNNTYSNECDAKKAGINVLYLGACKGLDNCTTSKDCHRLEYCDNTPTKCQGQGRCASRPDVCLSIYAPVCGCDGVTYTNPCEAAASGASVVATGACPSASCLSDGACSSKNSSTFCRFASQCTGNGTCVAPPDFCIQLWRPVCGCDGHTYSNECYAAAAYTSVKSQGACPSDEDE